MTDSGVLAVVVNYGAGDLLLKCIQSIHDAGADTVALVDNSPDDRAKMQLEAAGASFHYVPAPSNRGYGTAVNLGVRRHQGDPLLVCNPDVVLHPGALDAMLQALEKDPGIGMVGPMLVEQDGTLYPSARHFPSIIEAAGHGFIGLFTSRNVFSRRYKMLDWDHSSQRDVDWLSGACMLVRREAFEQLCGFDESYFMYLEDVDLCWRAHQSGWRVVYEPASVVVHEKGTSTARHPYAMIAAHHRSILRFAFRTTTGRKRALLPIVAAAVVSRELLLLARQAIYGLASRRRGIRG